MDTKTNKFFKSFNPCPSKVRVGKKGLILVLKCKKIMRSKKTKDFVVIPVCDILICCSHKE